MSLRSRALAAPLALAGVLLTALPASAHVTVTPATAEPGSSTELTFRVPDEESTADTDRVDVLIPTDHPIAQLLVKPVPGWTSSTKTVTLARPLVTDDGRFTSVVSEVVWTGGRIAPGQYQDFSVSVDPLPDTATTLTFKTLQTYTNGDVVRWIDVPQPGQDEPEHPAPTLTLTTTDAAQAGGSVTADSPAKDDAPGWLVAVSIVALVLAAAALVVGLGKRRRTT